MTGGRPLPADFSQPPAPDAPDQPDGQGEPDDHAPGSTAPGGQQAGAKLPGLPRLYFAERPGQPQQNGEPGSAGSQGAPYGQPPAQDQGAPYGQPPSQGQDQGAPYGQPPDRSQYGRPQNQQENRASGGRSSARPPRQRPARQPDRELQHRGIASLVFGMLSLVALLWLGTDLRRGVYLLIFSALVGLAACVIGITALVKARRTSSFRPRGAVGGIVLGAIATLLSVPILATYLAFPTQVHNYMNCRSQAQTSADQQACANTFYKSIRLGTTAATAARGHGSAGSRQR